MSGPLRHLRILLGARLRALSNRLVQAWTSHGRLYLAATVVSVAVVVGLGELSAPALLEPPTDVAAGGAFGSSDAHARGTTALEAAFWLALLASAVTSFRVMEILYRRRDLRTVEAYPIRLPALFVDRALASLAESAMAAAAIGLFFVPLFWHGASDVAGLALLVVFGGMTAAAVLSFGLQVYAGYWNARAAGNAESSRSIGVYGGPGQLFMFSPGLALAATAIAILLIRLGVGELLGGDGSLRAFGVAVGLVGAAALASLIASYRRFVDAYPTMCARFREADAVSYTAELDYQTSDYANETRAERFLGDAAAAAYRVLSLQYGRGNSLVRYSYAIGWILGGVALTQWSRQAFPPWAVAMAPALVAATAANPWYRLVQSPLRPEFGRTLPIGSSAEDSAALALAARELTILALPYAGLVVWVDWGSPSAAAALLRGAGALLVPLGLDGIVALLWRIREPRPWSAFLVPLGASIGFLVLAILSLPAAVGTAAAVAALALVVRRIADTETPRDGGSRGI